jgi:hypothetical protein
LQNEEIAQPFFFAFWRRVLADAGFQFRAPNNVRAEIAVAFEAPSPQRLPQLFRALTKGLADVKILLGAKLWIDQNV